MAADSPNVRRLHELCACSSLYGGDGLIILNQDWHEIVQDVVAGRLDAEAMDAVEVSGLASSSCRGRLSVATASFTAELVFCMPVEYPVSAALQCHVECGQLSRQAVDQISQQVQQQAASLQGGSSAIADYLLKARTVCVDVDSSGRKCRERMMDVLDDSDAAGLTAGGSRLTGEQPWPAGASCSNFSRLLALKGQGFIGSSSPVQSYAPVGLPVAVWCSEIFFLLLLGIAVALVHRCGTTG
eukprot:gene10129-10287_t